MALRWATGADRRLNEEGWFTLGGTTPGPLGGNQISRTGVAARTGSFGYRCSHTVGGSNAHAVPGQPNDSGISADWRDPIRTKTWATGGIRKSTNAQPSAIIRRLFEFNWATGPGGKPRAIEWRTDGSLHLVDEANTSLASTADPFTFNLWHTYKLVYDEATENIKLIWDGVTKINYTHPTAIEALLYIAFGGFTDAKANAGMDVDFDDVFANDDGDRSGFNERLPDTEPPNTAMEIRNFRANGDTAIEEWTGSPDTVNLYTNWDDTDADSDTTYNETDEDSTAKRLVSEFQSLADVGVPGTHYVWGVHMMWVWKRISGDAGMMKLEKLVNGSWLSSDFGTTTQDYTRPKHLPTGEDAAGYAITNANFDAGQWGLRRGDPGSASYKLRVTSLAGYVVTHTTQPPEQPPPTGQRSRGQVVG